MTATDFLLRVSVFVVLLAAGPAAAVETVPDFGPGPYTEDCYAKNWPSEPFSIKKWSNTPEEQRYLLVLDFLESYNVVGEKRKYITDILGKPDSNYKKYLIYTVRIFDPEGCVHGFEALLQFHIDEADVVEEVIIRLD